MKFIKKEHHQVTSIFTYDIPDDEIIETFGSVERFKEILSHFNESDWDNQVIGEEPTDEENDLFLEFYENYGYDREDDWWTDRKGGYDVTYEVEDDE